MRSQARTKAASGQAHGDETKSGRRRGAAREALIEAAANEFNESGFEGTDTNRIARRAGYAPQTFYRHFKDKADVFIEVYRTWMNDEFRQVGATSKRGPIAASNVLIRHHTEYRGFRRSLRALSITDPSMGAARTENRRQQLALFAKGPYASLDRRAQVALLLCIERIADAAADGELADLGLSATSQAKLLAEVVAKLSERQHISS